MTTKYRYIGKGTTDSNGIAHMTEDADGQSCNGYTGTGKGLTDIIASTDDSTHISDSSILSEIYELIDALVIDNGISTNNDYNDSAWDNISYFSVFSRGTDGTTVTNNTGANRYLTANIQQGIPYDFSTPYRVEFDFEKLNTDNINSQIQMNNEDNLYFSQWLTTTGHYIINVNENEVNWSINGTEQTPKTVTLGTTFVRFYLPNGASFKFSNFKIYSI